MTLPKDFQENGRNREVSASGRWTLRGGRSTGRWRRMPTPCRWRDATPPTSRTPNTSCISSDGVLSFNSPPTTRCRGAGGSNLTDSNTYKVVVAASDDAPGAERTESDMIKMAYKKVTVTVTNVEETETVTLSARCRARLVWPLTATYNDLDNEKPTASTVSRGSGIWAVRRFLMLVAPRYCT